MKTSTTKPNEGHFFQWWYCFFLLASIMYFSLSASPPDNIKTINAKVSGIDDSIKNGDYAVLEISEQTVSEGSPPRFKMFYRENRLVAVFVSVGHETWSNEFRYFFYANGKPMKYLKTSDRPDNPAKQAILFDEKGAVVWKNTDEAPFGADELLKLFNKLQETRFSFSKY